jgi:diguanylate cyclase (GGDEF)-like protein
MKLAEAPTFIPFRHPELKSVPTGPPVADSAAPSKLESAEELCILLASENAVERNSLAQLVRGSILFRCQTHQAADFDSTTELIKRTRPDAIILDSLLPNGHLRQDAVTSMRSLARFQGDAAFIILAQEEDQAHAVYALQEGASDYLLKDQVQRNPLNFCRSIKAAVQRKLLEREFQRTVELLRERNRELEMVNQQLWKLSHTDELTGHFNRRHIMSRLDEEVARGIRYGSRLSVVLADIDHFKHINDTFGHLAGDRALQAIADLFRSKLRESDLIGRFGGEEFLLILPHTDLTGAEAFCHRLRDHVANHPVQLAEQLVYITSSFGLANLSPEIDTSQKLLRMADRNLYRAKTEGRNRVVAERNDAPFSALENGSTEGQPSQAENEAVLQEADAIAH